MDQIIFHKKIYWKHEEDYLFVTVTHDMNGYFIWYESSHEGCLLIDYHSWDRDLMLEKAVDISRLPIDDIKSLIIKPKIDFIFKQKHIKLEKDAIAYTDQDMDEFKVK